MSKIAIDIVILPPPEVMDKIIWINEQAESKWGSLEKDDWLPHLSLAMGCIDSTNLAIVNNIVKTTADKFNPISVELNEVYYAEKTDGSRTYCLRAKKNQDLQVLHENLMNELKPYLSNDCTKETLYSKPDEELIEPDYINNFAPHSFENFDPHITIRTKEEAGKNVLPLNFVATNIAVCHAGIYTTCRKILFSIKLTTAN